MDNNHDDWIDYLFLYVTCESCLRHCRLRRSLGRGVLYRTETVFISSIFYSGKKSFELSLNTSYLGAHSRFAMRGSRSEICQCVLAENGHGKPIDGAQESAELGSWPRRFPYDSAETCVSPNFVLAFDPTQQKVRP